MLTAHGTICMLKDIWHEWSHLQTVRIFLLIFDLFDPRRSVCMPLADLPVRCCSCAVCGWGRLDRFSIRLSPTFSFLRLFGFFCLFVLPHRITSVSPSPSSKWKRKLDGGLTSCHPQTGLKLSKKPTSSNRFGYSHSPGGTVKTVTQNSIRRKIAIAKNKPISPRKAMLRYQTPILNFTGHSGNMTTVMININAPTAYSFVRHCGPSYSQT